MEVQTAHGKYLILNLWVTQLRTQHHQARAKNYSPIVFEFNEKCSEGGRNPCEGEGEGDISDIHGAGWHESGGLGEARQSESLGIPKS
jgi:hypothetical protein